LCWKEVVEKKSGDVPGLFPAGIFAKCAPETSISNTGYGPLVFLVNEHMRTL